jgi:Ca2+-transporting ATPase
VCSLLLLAAAFLPGLSGVLKVVPIGKEGWLLVAVMSLVPLVLGQAWLALEKRLGKRSKVMHLVSGD